MLEDVKIIIGIVVMSILSAIVRFKSFGQCFIDSVLGFLMGYSLYMLLEYFNIADGVKCGIVGMVILVCRPLYDTAENFIRNKLSEILTKKIEDDKH